MSERVKCYKIGESRIECCKLKSLGKSMCSIVSEIEKVEQSIRACFYKVEALQENLKSRYISMEERERLEKELVDVKHLLSQNESELRSLHKENSKTFAVAVIIMFFAFLIYGIYKMITN